MVLTYVVKFRKEMPSWSAPDSRGPQRVQKWFQMATATVYAWESPLAYSNLHFKSSYLCLHSYWQTDRQCSVVFSYRCWQNLVDVAFLRSKHLNFRPSCGLVREDPAHWFSQMLEEMYCSLRIFHWHNSAFACFSTRDTDIKTCQFSYHKNSNR